MQLSPGMPMVRRGISVFQYKLFHNKPSFYDDFRQNVVERPKREAEFGKIKRKKAMMAPKTAIIAFLP